LTRKLDFIVFGLPRGGTTAVSHYISATEGFHCGVEVFPTFLDHATLNIPDGFLTRQHKLWNGSSVDEVTALKDRIRVYGNKTPTYFYRLPSLLAELDNCPAIACVRDLRSVATSYSKRAADPEDPWVEGRVGLFAMGDALLLLHALHNAPAGSRVMILPQGALLQDWRGVMTRALHHIAPSVLQGADPEFDADKLKLINQIRTREESREKPALDPVEERALKRLTRDGVMDFFTRPEPVLLDEVRGEIAAILAKTPPNPVAFVRHKAEEHPNAAVREFFKIWSRHAGRAWQTYRPAAGDSDIARSAG